MTYSFKQLTENDVQLLKQLLAVFAKAFDEPDTYQGNIPSQDYLQALLYKEHFFRPV